MKRNISINISGIIFHIEEDGYDKLKAYLTAINRYFSTYEDSGEIISDIENRIAEIFLARLGDQKQVITSDDVNDLITTMGNVSDFEAADDRIWHTAEEPSPEEPAHTHAYQEGSEPAAKARKLYRDMNRKLLGGVAAGIAHYFSIDPLWIRLLFLATFFDLFVMVSISGVAVISYIILWVITPASYDLPEDTRIRRLFRDPDSRVLGGVAGGLSAYFGIDINVVRMLFVATMLLGGTGLVAYLMFWIITPEAKTLTDRMQMEGEPITLSNIERKIKESLNINEEAEENIFVKALLFPFRLLALLLDAVNKSASPLFQFMAQLGRYIGGAGMLFVSAIVAIVLFALLATGLGIWATPAEAQIGDLPLAVIKNTIPFTASIGLFILLFIPNVTLAIAGVSLLAGRKVVGSVVAWSLFGVWLVGLGLALTTLPGFIQDYQSEATHREEQIIKANKAEVMQIGINQLKNNTSGIGQIELTIKGYNGNEVKMVKVMSARGRNRDNAVENATQILYQAQQEANILKFNNLFDIAPSGKYKLQQLKIELYMPYGQEFTLQPGIRQILRNTLYPFGYSARHLNEENRWVYSEEGLRCLTCTIEPTTASAANGRQGELRSYSNFDELAFSHHFEVEIRQGETYEILLEGNNKHTPKISITQEDRKLTFGVVKNKQLFSKVPVKIYITMPALKKLQAEGAGDISLSGFDAGQMELQLGGAVSCQADININNMEAYLSGKSDLTLSGKGERLSLVLSGASDANTFSFNADNVNVSASGKSLAQVLAHKQIEIASSGASEVIYKGNPNVLNASGKFGASGE
jgi:phage shock protein PspC (stress-responsive transcriptional regulator)